LKTKTKRRKKRKKKDKRKKRYCSQLFIAKAVCYSIRRQGNARASSMTFELISLLVATAG